jgi:concentrative nucleoside transporter, CNT family
MGMERLVSLLGLGAMLVLAWLLSENRRRINVRLVVSGVLLQFGMALLLLRTGPGRAVFDVARRVVTQLLAFSDSGAEFVFGPNFADHKVAFSVLPAIIFVSSLTAVLFHLGILQWVVRFMARVMVWVMNVSGSESLCASANVFVGMTEAPLVIRPYLATMTRSELMAMMSAGMATIAGGVMAVYVGMGADAGHLLAASLMSAPAALVVAKIMVPEAEQSPTMGVVRVEVPRTDANVVDAACRGAGEGLMLALNVAAMLIAFIALIAMINWPLSLLPPVAGAPLSLERILGWIMAPAAWLMGVSWSEAREVGMLMGKKTIFNEFLAYQDLTGMRDRLSPRAFTLATYALCGFANFGSMAIMIGGIGGLVPSRRPDIARYGFRALVAGTLAVFMTACIAGVLM